MSSNLQHKGKNGHDPQLECPFLEITAIRPSEQSLQRRHTSTHARTERSLNNDVCLIVVTSFCCM